MVSAAARKPRRVSLTNLNTGEGWMAMFNPTTFEEQVEVNWNRQHVLGLSHEPLQYGNTGNWNFELDLYMRGNKPTTVNPFTEATVKDKSPKGLSDIMAIRKFLMSLAYPVSGATIGEGGPPRVLVVWPHIMSLVCVVTSLKLANQRFNFEGYPVEYVASVGFEEIRDTRITSGDIRQLGTERSDS